MKETNNCKIDFINGFFDQIPDPVMIVGKDFKIVAYNKTAEKMFAKQELEKYTCYNVLFDNDQPCMGCNGAVAFDTGEMTEALKKDSKFGKVIYNRAIPLKNESGEVQYVALIYSEVPDEEKFLNTIRHEQKYINALLKSLPDMIFVMNSEGRYIDYKLAEDFEPHVTPATLLNKTVYDIFPEQKAKNYAGQN